MRTAAYVSTPHSDGANPPLRGADHMSYAYLQKLSLKSASPASDSAHNPHLTVSPPFFIPFLAFSSAC